MALIAIGLCLSLIHLISIPVTNSSVNLTRGTDVAILAGGWAIAQLWLFGVAPIFGAVLGATVCMYSGAARKIKRCLYPSGW